MSLDRFPVGLEMDVSYPDFRASLTLLSAARLRFDIKDGPFARTETVDIHVVPLGNSLFAVSWQEKDGATVTNVQNYDRGLVHSFATLPDGRFLRMTGPFEITRPADLALDDRPHRNKALVLEAMTSLFQRHDASAVTSRMTCRVRGEPVGSPGRGQRKSKEVKNINAHALLCSRSLLAGSSHRTRMDRRAV